MIRTATVCVEPQGFSFCIPKGMTLLDALRSNHIFPDSDCGGKAACGKCKVRILASETDAVSPVSETELQLLSKEEVADGIRLACKTLVLGNLTVCLPEIADETCTQILTDAALLPGRNVESIPDNDDGFGAAIDIGTTTLAAYLYKRNSGRQLATTSDLNPQIPYGTDVISRIAACEENPDHLFQMQDLLINKINLLLFQLADTAGITSKEIGEVVLVGNTVMEHILLGVSPSCLGKAPFTPLVKDLLQLSTDQLPLSIHPEGRIHILPAADGFIGGDHISVLLSTDPKSYDGNTLVVDIGTNTEISLWANGKLYSTSCATGPALEGACIRFGMRASEGAIEHVSIDPVTLEPVLKVIGNLPPKGICGSGILDAVSQMAQTGILNPDGTISARFSSERIVSDAAGNRQYLLCPSEKIFITQEDVRAVQLAKAALYAGIQLLLKRSGTEQADRILLAGGFGYYIDPVQALLLGMFPDCDPESIIPVGNAALGGAVKALLDPSLLRQTASIAGEIHFVESAKDPDFQKLYAEAMYLPHKTVSFHLGKDTCWKCPGIHAGTLPEEVFWKKIDILSDPDAVIDAVTKVRNHRKENFYTFPLVQNMEACVYGASVEKKKNYWAPGTYPYTKPPELTEKTFDLMHDPRIQALLEGIGHLNEEMTEYTQENQSCIILEASAPFTILTSLVDPRKVYAAMRKEPELIRNLLQKIAEAELPFLEAALRRGCSVISLADPLGTIAMNGERNYREILAPSVLTILKKMKRHTKKGLIHLCGRMATDLITSGYAVSYPLRTRQYGTYAEQLASVSDDPKIRMIGPGCVHCTRPAMPILQLFELNGGK